MGFNDINLQVSGPQQPASIYKTKVLKGQVPFAIQVTEPNTKYVIKHNFVLNGDVTIPENCILEFDGGSISGEHTITGNNTSIEVGLVKVFGIDVTLAGTWNIAEAYPEWFGAKGDGITDDADAIQKAVDTFNYIVFTNPIYLINTNQRSDTGISITRDNVTLISNCRSVLKQAATSAVAYRVIQITDAADNVTICGLQIIADKSTQTTSGEHGFGISIIGESSHVHIIDNEIEGCFGDGIYVNKVSDFIIENNKIHDCRRQGISVIVGETGCIKGNEIYNIAGTNPQSGIDLEANPADLEQNRCINNIVIENNYIHDIVSVDHTSPDNISIGKDILISCGCKKISVLNSTHNAISMDYQAVTDGQISIDNVTCEYLLVENRVTPNRHTLNVINSTINFIGLVSTFNALFEHCLIHDVRYLSGRNGQGGEIIFNGCELVSSTGDAPINVQSGGDIVLKRFVISKLKSKLNGGRGIKITAAEEVIVTDSYFYADNQTSIADVPPLDIACNSLVLTNNVFNLNNITYFPTSCVVDLKISSALNIINDSMIGGSDVCYPIRIQSTSALLKFYILNCNYSGLTRRVRNESQAAPLINNVIYKNSNCPIAGVATSGSFQYAPNGTDIVVGFKYFCTSGASIDGGTTETQNIPIYYTGSGWVDANGNNVVAKS